LVIKVILKLDSTPNSYYTDAILYQKLGLNVCNWDNFVGRPNSNSEFRRAA